MFCSRVKEFLSQQGIEFTERNVAEDGSALSELEQLGVMTTPVTVINGEIVIGFDQPKLERLLRI
ncbi:MAG TPA: glutaredoxin family protein [Anaerolineae bacterium]|nr:glutaredoxin family protein [Anaerolineae bacterium]